MLKVRVVLSRRAAILDEDVRLTGGPPYEGIRSSVADLLGRFCSFRSSRLNRLGLILVVLPCGKKKRRFL